MVSENTLGDWTGLLPQRNVWVSLGSTIVYNKACFVLNDLFVVRCMGTTILH